MLVQMRWMGRRLIQASHDIEVLYMNTGRLNSTASQTNFDHLRLS